MADIENKRPTEAAEEDLGTLKPEIDHGRSQLHNISPGDDARVRRKIDMVVLPVVSVAGRKLATAAKPPFRCASCFSSNILTSSHWLTLQSMVSLPISISRTPNTAGLVRASTWLS